MKNTANAKRAKNSKDKAPDIVNEFLTMNGRIEFHYGEVHSRRFVGKNKIEEKGYWFANIIDNFEDTTSYRIPYKLLAVLGKPIERKFRIKQTKAGAR